MKRETVKPFHDSVLSFIILFKNVLVKRFRLVFNYNLKNLQCQPLKLKII